MPPFLRPILTAFIDSYGQEKKNINRDRDAVLNLCLYFSCFMDSQIKAKKSKAERAKYTKLKTFGLDYIKYNHKRILSHLKITSK